MADIMTPSVVMTDGQIGKINDLLAAGLRKANLKSEFAQQIIEHNGSKLVDALVAVIRKYVEATSNLIYRTVTVNCERTPQQALDATKRKQYIGKDVLNAMSRSTGGMVELVLFHLNRQLTDDQLEEEFDLRGLRPATLYEIAAMNEVDPAFADDYPNATHCKDGNDKWCYAAFHRFNGLRLVHVLRYGVDWDDRWRFVGVRK